VFDALFLLWLAIVAAGIMLNVKGTRQGNARKRTLGRRLLVVAGLVVLGAVGGMIYLVALEG
jgi:hypothetical protein